MSEELDRLRKLARRVLGEGGEPGAEHERLRVDLAAWAIAKGFNSVYPDLDGKRPDVLRSTGRFLFVGDAKDAENEPLAKVDTMERVLGYFLSFARRVQEGKIDGGYVAIATNDHSAALGWAAFIGAVFKTLEIVRQDGRGPSVLQLDQNTWVAWW